MKKKNNSLNFLSGIIEIKDLKKGSSNFYPMHSFVSNFLAMLQCGFGYNPSIDIKNRSGATGDQPLKEIIAGSNNQDCGIILGSGDTPVSVQDFALESPISVECQSVAVEGDQLISGFYVIDVHRIFTNDSGNNLTIKEIGIFSGAYLSGTPWMIIRDVLETPEQFDAGDEKHVIYYIGITSNLNIQFIHFLQAKFQGVEIETRDTGNDVRETNFSTYRVDANAGVKNYGIVIGSGTTIPTINDYCLETPILTGVNFGNTETSGISAPEGSAIVTMGIKRHFDNISGGQISVSEIGLVIVDNDGFAYLIARFTISPIIVSDNQGFNVRVNFKTYIQNTEFEEEQPE